ncbi:hypothetical protein ACS8FD_15160, partial [Psychrobacter sp. 1U2]
MSDLSSFDVSAQTNLSQVDFSQDDLSQDDVLQPDAKEGVDGGQTYAATNVVDMPAEPDIDALLDIADEASVTWVREQAQLDEVIKALEVCGRVALDTEFIKRDTYYPRLALVQLNTGDHIYLLDAPQLQ